MSSSFEPLNHGQPLRHACAPGQHAVGGVDDDLQPQIEERCAVVAVDDRVVRQEREDEPAGRVEVNEPGGNDGRSSAATDAGRRPGKSLHTGTPQKCEPSVQRGEISPLRITHGGPMWRPMRGCTARTCSISSIDAR